MKQYTEAELRAEFESGAESYEIERFDNPDLAFVGEYKNRTVEAAWSSFMRCAHFLGAIKENT